MLFSKFYEITTSSKNARASFIFTYCYVFIIFWMVCIRIKYDKNSLPFIKFS